MVEYVHQDFSIISASLNVSLLLVDVSSVSLFVLSMMSATVTTNNANELYWCVNNLNKFKFKKIQNTLISFIYRR